MPANRPDRVYYGLTGSCLLVLDKIFVSEVFLEFGVTYMIDLGVIALFDGQIDLLPVPEKAVEID